MNKRVVDFLIERDVFCAVMVAMRGPDDGNEGEKLAYTAVLRWAVGFDYGMKAPPSSGTFEHGHLTRSHYYDHVRRAFMCLEAAGWEIDRIPLRAYLDPEEAIFTAVEVLTHARAGLRSTADLELLGDVMAKVRRAPASDPDFKLSLPNYERERG